MAPATTPTTRQWLSFVSIIWLQSFNGTSFLFPAYSSHLKHALSATQFQVNYLSFASDAGKLFAWFSGVASTHLPLWLVLLLGSSIGFLSYGLQFLFISYQTPSLSYPQVFILTIMAGNSVCWINTVCYVVAIRNFPSNPQLIVGISTSYQALSAKIYTDIVGAITTRQSSSHIKTAQAYLLCCSTFPLLASVVTGPFIKNMGLVAEKKRSMYESGGFVALFAITACTGVAAVIGSMESILRGGSSLLWDRAGMGVFIIAPLLVPMWSCTGGRWFGWRRVGVEEKEEQERKGRDACMVVEGGGGMEMESRGDGIKAATMEEIGVKEMIQKVNFWLYVMVYLFGATVGMVYMSNLGQIAESRGYSRPASLLSLSSSFAFFGRLLPSLLDHISSSCKNKLRASRPAWMGVLTMLMSVAFFLLTIKRNNTSLFASTAVVGVCTGAMTAAAVSMTTELFGFNNFNLNHNIVVANIPVGSLVYGSMAAYIYRREGEDGACMGTKCYELSFLAWGSLCLLGSVLSFILHARTRHFYSSTYV